MRLNTPAPEQSDNDSSYSPEDILVQLHLILVTSFASMLLDITILREQVTNLPTPNQVWSMKIYFLPTTTRHL